MLDYHNIKRNTYYGAKERGKSIEGIISGKYGSGNKKRVTDHLVNQFESIRDMLKHHDVEEQTYYYRIRNGHSLAESLKPINYINK